MQITIFGGHTTNYCEPPYEQLREFEGVLKRLWPAVWLVSIDSIDTASVHIRTRELATLTVQQVYEKLSEVVALASSELDWDIWSVDINT